MKEAFEKLQKEFGEMVTKFNQLVIDFGEQGKKLLATETELNTIKTERAKEQNDFAEQQKKDRLNGETKLFDSFLEGLIQEGKVLAGEKDALMAEFADTYKANAALSFAAGEKDLVTKFKDRLSAREKKNTQSREFADNKKAKKVDPKDIPASFAGMDVTTDGLDIHADALEYIEKHPGTSYEKAIEVVTR